MAPAVCRDMSEVRHDRREEQRVEHHVEGIEHPAERGGDEGALRVRRAVAPPCRRSAGGPWLARARQETASCAIDQRTARAHDDATLLETVAQQPGQLGSASRVAVDAERVDREGQGRTIRRRHLSVGHHAQRATDHLLGVVNDRAGGGPRRQRPIWRRRRDRRSLRTPREDRPPRPRSGARSQAARRGRATGRRRARRARSRRPAGGRGRPCCRARRALSHGRAAHPPTRQSPPARRSDRAPDPRPRAATHCSSRRPNPTRSGNPGCAPTATPASRASRTVCRITPGSPA